MGACYINDVSAAAEQAVREEYGLPPPETEPTDSPVIHGEMVQGSRVSEGDHGYSYGPAVEVRQ